MVVVCAVFFFVARAFNRGLELWQTEQAAEEQRKAPGLPESPPSEQIRAADDALQEPADPGNFTQG